MQVTLWVCTKQLWVTKCHNPNVFTITVLKFLILYSVHWSTFYWRMLGSTHTGLENIWWLLHNHQLLGKQYPWLVLSGCWHHCETDVQVPVTQALRVVSDLLVTSGWEKCVFPKRLVSGWGRFFAVTGWRWSQWDIDVALKTLRFLC